MELKRIGNYFDILSKSQKAYTRQLEPVCKKWNMTRSEVDVMLFLYNNSQYDRAADVAARRGMAKSHVSMSVASLEERGLLLRRFSDVDRRTAHLLLTDAGREIAAEAKVAQKEFLDCLYAGVSPEEMAVMAAITQRVSENIDKFEKSQNDL